MTHAEIDKRTAQYAGEHPEATAEAVALLKPAWQDIIKARFGFDGGAESTLADLALPFSVSLDDIAQIEQRFLHRMQSVVFQKTCDLFIRYPVEIPANCQSFPPHLFVITDTVPADLPDAVPDTNNLPHGSTLEQLVRISKQMFFTEITIIKPHNVREFSDDPYAHKLLAEQNVVVMGMDDRALSLLCSPAAINSAEDPEWQTSGRFACSGDIRVYRLSRPEKFYVRCAPDSGGVLPESFAGIVCEQDEWR